MKKVFVMLFAVVIAASAWASPSPAENEKVMLAFEKQFAEATNVTWTEKNGYFLASFRLNNDRMVAWYTPDGEVEVIQRSIQLPQMTLLASQTVAQLLNQKTLLALAEVAKNGESFYLAKIEDEKCISIYKVSASGDYTRIEKTKKKK